jgi:hypothetical protein
MKHEHHPYPPFDFNFYIDTDISFEQNYQRAEEFQNQIAVSNRDLFKFTPYIRGKCNICGKETVFFCKNLIHPRDYLICMNCGSSSRYRSIARGVISALQSLTSKQIDSLFDLKNINLYRNISIYDTQIPFSLGIVTYPIPYFLSLSENIELYLSDFNSQDEQIGVNGEVISSQDLQNLNYESNKFDIVITSDIMEHVRLPNKAHAEISRVTKNNCFYIFTVPHFRDSYKTNYLVKVHDENDPDKDEYLVEPVYHGDPNSSNAAIVYQIFGLDLDDTLKKYSFDVKYTNDSFIENGILGTELFFCKKSDLRSPLQHCEVEKKYSTKPSILKRLLNFKFS